MKFVDQARHASPMIRAESRRLRDRSAGTRGSSARATVRAAATRQRFRETLMRYVSHRMVAIRGGSDLRGDPVTGAGHRQRLLVRTVAAHWPVQFRVGPSAGATCMLCCGAIPAGTPQYDIDAGPGRIIADDGCYMSFLRDVIEGTPEC